MKWRNSKERELLSSGASRDVTLPSKDNPHPDLSDVTSRRHDGMSNDIVVMGCHGDPRVHQAAGGNAYERDVIRGGSDDVVYDVIVNDKQYFSSSSPSRTVDKEDIIQVV